MLKETVKENLSPFVWPKLLMLFGDPPEMANLRSEAERLQQELQGLRSRVENETNGLKSELDRSREEKLQWMGKEATTRKELQDSLDRNKDLLEQVVRLTHIQRQSKQGILEEQFKAVTSPTERNRFEIELAELRGKSKRAEERALHAEEKLARMQTLEKEAARAKTLETELAWEKEKSAKNLQALQAAVERVKELEHQLEEHRAKKSAPKSTPATKATPAPKPSAKLGAVTKPAVAPKIETPRKTAALTKAAAPATTRPRTIPKAKSPAIPAKNSKKTGPGKAKK